MAKEIFENEHEQFTNKRSNNIIYRDQFEYTSSRMFWGSALVLGSITIYASLVFLVVKQLKKD